MNQDQQDEERRLQVIQNCRKRTAAEVEVARLLEVGSYKFTSDEDCEEEGSIEILETARESKMKRQKLEMLEMEAKEPSLKHVGRLRKEVDRPNQHDKGPGFDLKFSMSKRACSEDRLKMPPPTVEENPLRCFKVPQTAMVSLHNVLHQIVECSKQANRQFPKTAFKTCLSCWHKRTYPVMTEDAILLYSYLLKTDAQAIMYDVKAGMDICDDCQG